MLLFWLSFPEIVHSDSLDNGLYLILIRLKALFFFSSFTRCRSLRHFGRPFNRNFSDHDFAANSLLPDISLACDKQQQRKWKQKEEDSGLIFFFMFYYLVCWCFMWFVTFSINGIIRFLLSDRVCMKVDFHCIINPISDQSNSEYKISKSLLIFRIDY